MTLLVGIDEAGRGALAGPLFVCVVLGDRRKLNFAQDSKSILRDTREKMAVHIMVAAESVGVGWVSARTIDRLGISMSLTIATQRAFSRISYKNQPIIIDGPYDFLKLRKVAGKVTTVISADQLVKQVSAASIIAKTTRDKYMRKQAKKFPGWGFDRNVGYGTADHIKMLQTKKPTILHRRSFKPINEYPSRKKR